MQEPRVEAEPKPPLLSRAIEVVRRHPYLLYGPPLLALLAFLGVILRPAFFEAAQIDIRGNDQVKTEEILRIAKAPKGASLFSFPGMRVRRNILSESRIRSARVARDFPSRIVVTVRERRPVARVSVGDRSVLLDDEGVVLGEESGTAPEGLPTIEELPVASLPAGKKVRTASLTQVLRFLKTSDEETLSLVEAVRADAPDRITLVTAEGIEILYGKAVNVRQKNFVVKKILAGKRENIIYMDVRVYTNPVVKRLGKSSSGE